MRRTMIAGLALAVLAALVTSLGELIGFDLEHVALLGGAIGGALGLVPHRFAWGRVAGFLLGFVAAWIGFGLRAALLPDSTNGRAVAAFLVIGICTLACAVSAERLPLWSALLGVAAIVGAYEEIYTNAPSQFIAQSPDAATTVLLAAALGYLATSVVYDLIINPRDDDADSARHGGPGDQPRHSDPEGSTDEMGRLDGLMAGEKK